MEIPAIRPPRGRRPWLIPPKPLDQRLKYLAWGLRRYGDNPLPKALQAGFTYIYLVEGNPVIECGDCAVACEPGMFFILDRTTALGWQAQRGDQQVILCWIWEVPPFLPELRPQPGGFVQLRPNQAALREVSHLHRITRGEMSRSDAYTLESLALIQRRLDIALARCLRVSDPEELHSGPTESLIQWMQAHLHSTRPVADLADWCQLSPQSLRRQFVKTVGVSPLSYFNQLKAEEATRLLLSGETVKAVAYKLGYRHVHDFSRFYQNHTGNLPSQVRAGC